MKHHETTYGERVALAWHLIWAVLCLNTLCGCVAMATFLWPYLRSNGTALALVVALLGQGVMSAGGVLWHVFGALEHRKALCRLGTVNVQGVGGVLTKADEQRITDICTRKGQSMNGQTHLGHHIGPAPTDAELGIGNTMAEAALDYQQNNAPALELAYYCAKYPVLLGLLCVSCSHPVASHVPGKGWPCTETSHVTNEKCKCSRGVIRSDDLMALIKESV